MNLVFNKIRFLAFAFIFCFSVNVFGQSSTADLSGTVKDSNGAWVPQVSVVISNETNNIKREFSTNEDGVFTFSQLLPGTYKIEATKQGFNKTTLSNLVLNIGDRRFLAIELSVGQVNATVEVGDQAALIDESPEVSTVIDRRFVSNLPLNGRSFQSLITLAPGTVLTKSTFLEPGQFSVNGQRANANYFTVDGVSANIGIGTSSGLGQFGAGSTPGLAITGGTNSLVAAEALEEFRLQTSTYAAEFGRQPGGQVQILTRSGTNKFTGSLFNYFRNDALDANDFFANREGLPRPPLRQNNFGGTFGGAIPSLKTNGEKNTFFFFSYEGLRLRQPRVGITEVPTVAARQAASGIFRDLLNVFPLPNGDNTRTDLAQFAASYSDETTLDAFSIRIDHRLSEKATLFGRYNYSPSDALSRSGSVLSSLTRSGQNIQTLTLGLNYSFNSAVSNDFRFNYSRTNGTSESLLDNFGGAISQPTSRFLGSSAPSEGLFGLNFSGLSLFVGKGNDKLQRQLNFVNNLAMIVGAHSLKFGADIRRLTPTFQNPAYTQNTFFRNVAAVQTGTLRFLNVSSNDAVNLLYENYSLYSQDTWRVTPRLTLTYGLRWEFNPAPKARNGQQLFPVSSIADPENPVYAPAGSPLYNAEKANFAPRIGMAYQLSTKPGTETVLRGGFGVFYDLGSGSLGDVAISFPFSRSRFTFGGTYPLSVEAAAAVPFRQPPPVDGTLFVADPNLKLPYTLQGNFTIEQSLGKNQSLSIGYVTAIGRRLLRQESLVIIEGDAFGGLFVTRNAAESDYHALQTQFTRRLTKGLQFLASYTYSHSIDTTSDDSATSNPTALFANVEQDRASSDFDVRHAFTSAVSYDIPTPFKSGLGRKIFGGFSLDAIYMQRTGTPVNVFSTRGAGLAFVSLRPDYLSGQPLYINDRNAPGGRKFNFDAFDPFTPDGEGRQGNLGRNVLRGFGLSQLDLALRREFRFGEKYRLQLKAEAFNLLNRPNFANPIGDLDFGSESFGISNSMLGRSLSGGGNGFNSLYQVGGPRSFQLSARFIF